MIGTALHWAVIKGHKDMVLLLLQKGADPNAAQGGETALHISLHNTDIVNILKEYGATI